MSHFTVAVFTEPNGKTVEELLAPYDEGISVAPYIYRTKEQMIEDAKSKKATIIERIKERPELESEGWVQKLLKAETDEEFYQTQVYEDDKYDEDGNELSTYNPNSKWDWYSIGGRWAGLIKAKNGDRGETSWCNAGREYKDDEFDSALVSDLNLEPDKVAYDKAIRFWEVVVEDAPLKEGEEKPFAWRKEYYLETYKNKETYAMCSSQFTTYAVVLPNGKWYENGQMGWWGMSSETPQEKLDWELHYRERFLDTAKPDWTLTLVDCHI